jgi:imidazolonepropionase-like amidohydrolase
MIYDTNNFIDCIVVGKKASIIITKALNSITELFYYFGENNIDQVIVEGKIVEGKAN